MATKGTKVTLVTLAGIFFVAAVTLAGGGAYAAGSAVVGTIFLAAHELA